MRRSTLWWWAPGALAVVLGVPGELGCGESDSAESGRLGSDGDDDDDDDAEYSGDERSPCASGRECRSGCCAVTGECLPAGSCAADTCPGETVRVGREPVQLGAQFLASDDDLTHCAPPGTSEVVYALEPTLAGSLKVTAQGARVQLRTTCEDESTTLSCVATAPTSLAVVGEERYYAILELTGGNTGSVTVEVSPAVCGDGALNDGEECDFGDDVAGDGCDSECRFEPVEADTDHCPAVDYILHGGEEFLASGHTVGYADETQAPCGALTGGRDRVYRFTVDQVGEGLLRLEAAGDFDLVLGVYSSCVSPRVEGLLSCSDGEYPLGPEALEQRVTGGEHFYVVVDGFHAGSMGSFDLRASLKPAEEP